MADDASLEAEVGARGDDAEGHDLAAADGGDHERALREPLGRAVGEGPVGVGDDPIDAEEAAAAPRDDGAEELGAAALDERERGRGGAPALGGR